MHSGLRRSSNHRHKDLDDDSTEREDTHRVILLILPVDFHTLANAGFLPVVCSFLLHTDEQCCSLERRYPLSTKQSWNKIALTKPSKFRFFVDTEHLEEGDNPETRNFTAEQEGNIG